MKFRNLMMLAGIGGLVYAHKKRGGQMTLDSFKASGRELLDKARSRVDDLRSQAESRIHDVAGRVVDKTSQQGSNVGGDINAGVEQGGSFSEDVTGYGSSGYGYGTRR
jgi:hypothetical protein